MITNVIVSDSQSKAEEYCEKNRLPPAETFIIMFLSEIGNVISNWQKGIQVHDLNKNCKYNINNVTRID